MSDMAVFISELADVTEGELGALPLGGEHSFSRTFDRKMQRLINTFPGGAMTLGRRVAVAVCAAAALAVLAIPPAAVYFLSGREDDTADSSYVDICPSAEVCDGLDLNDYMTYIYEHEQKPSVFSYNYFPSLKGKLHSPDSGSIRARRPQSVADGRELSDTIAIVTIVDDGEIRDITPNFGTMLCTRASVQYDVTDRYNEVCEGKPMLISINTQDIPEGARFEKGRDMLMMLCKAADGSYMPVCGIDSCFYINTADMTVTSVSDNPVCTKYDGLSLGMLVYDMRRGEDKIGQMIAMSNTGIWP